MRVKLGVLALALIVCGCRKGPSLAERGAGPVAGQAAQSPSPGQQPKQQPDQEQERQPGFDVAVRLSPRAKAELTARAETVIVDVSFIGGPKAGTPAKYVGQDGQVIGLGDQRVEVAPGATARLSHLLADKKALAYVEGAPGVLVNVYSGRKSSKDNLLDCGIYEGPLSTIADSVLPIDCKLIAE